MYTSLGCPFQCSFCSVSVVYGKRIYRKKSPERVIQEFDILYNKYGIKHIEIIDDTFTLDKIERGQDVSWSNYVRGMAYVMQAAGHKLQGFDGLIHSNVPFASGLSSSAAIEMATAVTFQQIGEGEVGDALGVLVGLIRIDDPVGGVELRVRAFFGDQVARDVPGGGEPPHVLAGRNEAAAVGG